MKLPQRPTAIELHRVSLLRAMRADAVGEAAQAALQAEREEQELEKNDPKVSADTLTQSVDAKLGGSLRRSKKL